MKKEIKSGNKPTKREDANNFEKPAAGYPRYPAEDDIYNKGKIEIEIDPENVFKHKTPNEQTEGDPENDFDDVVTGADLDVPGSELDDSQEDIGSEDEENNYYSIGGDGHNDLEEDKG